MKQLIKRRNIIIAIIAIVIIGGASAAMSGASGILIEQETIDKGHVRHIIEEEAQVTSRNSRNVSVLVSGTVNTLTKSIGDEVVVGDLLATIDTTDVENELSIATEQLSALKYAFEDALEPNDREMIRQAEATYNAAVIARNSARETSTQNETLFTEGAISTQTLTDSKNALNLAQENVNGKYQALIQLRKGLSEALKNKFASEIRAKESSIEMLEVKKSRHEIRAEQSGVVLNRFVEAGDYVTTGSVTFEIANVLHVYFKSDILDSDVASIEVDTPVVIYLNDETTIDAIVTKIFPKAETQISDLGIEQKRVTVEIESVKDDLNVLIGQELDIDYITEALTDVVRVREELTYQRNGQYYVFVNEDDKAAERALETGLVGDTYIEVISGLQEGEIIIVPSDDIEPGVKVKLEE